MELNEHFICKEDLDLESHGIRTARLAVAIARVMDLPHGDIDSIGLAARLHDVGKTKVDPAIINKPGPLDADEWESLQRHPQVGYDMIHKGIIYVSAQEIVRFGPHPGSVGTILLLIEVRDSEWHTTHQDNTTGKASRSLT